MNRFIDDDDDDDDDDDVGVVTIRQLSRVMKTDRSLVIGFA